MLPHSLMLLKAFKQFSFWIFYVTVRGVALCIIITLQRFSSAQICWTIQPVLLLCKVVVCKSGKVFFGAVCNLVIPPLKSGPLEVNKPSIDRLLPWPQNRNGDFQSRRLIIREKRAAMCTDWTLNNVHWTRFVKHSDDCETLRNSFRGHTLKMETFNLPQRQSIGRRFENLKSGGDTNTHIHSIPIAPKHIYNQPSPQLPIIPTKICFGQVLLQSNTFPL